VLSLCRLPVRMAL